jgi:hypothetical protein
VLAGCANGQSSSCREPGETYPRPALSVAEAKKRDGELVLVDGALIARGGRPAEICEELSEEAPPRCEGATLKVGGLRDAWAFERGESRGDTQWWHGATTAGRIDGDTVRYELDCRTQTVQRQLGEAIGREPEFNAFSSSVEAEMIDYGPLPRLTPLDIRERYGAFALRVRTSDQPLEFPDDAEPGDRGIAWYLDGERWLALKLYGTDVMLLWSAGSEQRLDERWQRVDAIMRRVRLD